MSSAEENLIEKVEKLNKSKKSFTEFFNFQDGKLIKKILISKTKSKFEISTTEALAGKILSQLERNNIERAVVICSVDSSREGLFNTIKALTSGFLMKDYRFEKYKTITKKDFKVSSLSFIFQASSSEKKSRDSDSNGKRNLPY